MESEYFLNSTFISGFLNNIYLVLLIFSVSLLALNQSDILLSSKFAVSYNVSMSEEEICNVVSSAKSRVKSKLHEFAKSLMSKRNSIGPKIELCGTPQFTFCSADCHSRCSSSVVYVKEEDESMIP